MGSNEYRRSMALRTLVGTLSFQWRPELSADIYPIMKGASEFFYSTMVREPKHGWLVTAPTSSPENAFYLPGKDRTPISVCMGETMDIQLVRELYTNVIEASHILHTDTAYAEALQETIGLLPPHQISKKGYLMEWLEDYEETDIHHRHVSHLYGLHPGNQISVLKTPELAEACRKTLNRRGDEGTGWVDAWKINHGHDWETATAHISCSAACFTRHIRLRTPHNTEVEHFLISFAHTPLSNGWQLGGNFRYQRNAVAKSGWLHPPASRPA